MVFGFVGGQANFERGPLLELVVLIDVVDLNRWIGMTRFLEIGCRKMAL